MSRVLPMIGLVAASGCFYVDPINQRPSIAIHQTSSALVYRNQVDQVELVAVANDPDGTPDQVSVQWRVYLCTDGTPDTDGSRPGCDQAPYFTSIVSPMKFSVPLVRMDSTDPLQALFITLEGKDALGATARPIQQLVIAVADNPPNLALRKEPRHAYVAGVPVDLFAVVGDRDDGPTNVMNLDWQVFSPATQPAFTLVELTVPQDPLDLTHLQLGKVFTPMGNGDWDIQVTATDPEMVSTVEHLPITVVSDHPPCLSQWTPIASLQPGETLPLSDPTLFQILVVADDLDPFPSVPNDPILGQTSFSWSILPPGAGARLPLSGVTGNSVPLDPASYVPGDIVELRVEIADRNHTAITCADSNLTCSVISDSSCIQRLTWRVEVQ